MHLQEGHLKCAPLPAIAAGGKTDSRLSPSAHAPSHFSLLAPPCLFPHCLLPLPLAPSSDYSPHPGNHNSHSHLPSLPPLTLYSGLTMDMEHMVALAFTQPGTSSSSRQAMAVTPAWGPGLGPEPSLELLLGQIHRVSSNYSGSESRGKVSSGSKGLVVAGMNTVCPQSLGTGAR